MILKLMLSYWLIWLLVDVVNGQQVAASSANNVQVWDLIGRTLLRTFTGATGGAGTISACRFLTRDLLVYGDTDYSIKTFDWKFNVQTANISFAHTGTIRYLELMNNFLMASSSDDRSVKVWNMNTSSLVMNMTNHSNSVLCVRMLVNTTMLASGSSDFSIKVWHWPTGSLLFTLTGHTGAVNTIEYISNTVIASGSDDFSIRTWSLVNQSQISIWYGHTTKVSSLKLWTSDLMLSVSSLNIFLRIWSVSNGTNAKSLSCLTPNTDLEVRPDGNFSTSQTNGVLFVWTMWDVTYYYFGTSYAPVIHTSLTNSISTTRIRMLMASYRSQIRVTNPQTSVVEKYVTIYSSPATDYIRVVTYINQNVIAAGGDNSLIYIYDWKNSVMLRQISGHAGVVRAMELLADGQTIATGAEGAYWVRLSNIMNGSFIAGCIGHTARVNQIKQLYNGDIASASSDFTVRIWNVANQTTKFILTHTTVVYSLELLPNGTLLSGSGDGIRIWNPNTGQLLGTLSSISVVYTMKNIGNSMLAVGYTGYVRVFDFSNASLIYTFSSLAGTCQAVGLIETDYVVGASDNGLWYIYHMPSGIQVTKGTTTDSLSIFDMLMYDTDGPQLKGAFGSQNGNVYVWDIINQTSVMQFSPFSGPVLAIKFISYYRFIVAGQSGSIQIWSAQDATQILSITGQSGNITCLELLPNALLAAGSSDSSIMIWSYVNATLISNLTGHSSAVTSLKLLNTGNLASASFDSTVKIWDWNANNIVYDFTSHTDKVLCLEVVQNGSLASGSADTRVLIWNTETGSLIRSLLGHTGAVNSLKYIASYGYLASASSDNTIIIWNVALGTLVQTLVGHQSSVMSLDLLNDGVSVISGSLDKNVFVWNLTNNGTISRQFNHSDPICSVEIFNYEPPLVYITGRASDYNNPTKVKRASNITLSSWMFFPVSVATSPTYTFDFTSFNATLGQNFGSSINMTALNATFNSTSSSAQTFMLKPLYFGLYRVQLTVSLYTYDPPTWYYPRIDTYLLVGPSGINVRALANNSVNATFARYSSFTVAPANYSSDIDNEISMSSVTFNFYCAMINSSLGFSYYLNLSSDVDLYTAKANNITNSCFNKSNGYYFDSTGSVLYISPGTMNYRPGFNNEFIVTTNNYGVFNYQMVFLNINPTLTLIPAGNLSCADSSKCAASVNNSMLIDGLTDLVVNATCTYGCLYVDSVSYNYTVKKYNGSTWTVITSNMSEYSYISAASNQITLSKQLFQSGLVAWEVSVSMTTDSYGYKATSNTTISQVFVLNQVPYNSSCTMGPTSVITSLKSVYTTSCTFTPGSSLSVGSVTLRRLDWINITSLTFTPSISFTSLTYQYSMFYYNSSLQQTTGQINASRNSTVFEFTSFGFGWYQLQITALMSIKTPIGILNTSLTAYLNIQIGVTGINVASLPNNATNATFARYQSYALYPANFSTDLDSLINSSALNFSFYCQQLNQTQGAVYFLNTTSDLKTIKSNNNSSTCFFSTNGYYFDSTGNILYINPGYLIYSSGYLNEFIVTTAPYNNIYYQITFLNIDPTLVQTPVGNLNCLSSCGSISNSNNSFIIPASTDLSLNASCTSGCQYIDSVAYSFQVYEYNNTDWVLIDSSSSSRVYVNQSTNGSLILASGLFKTGRMSWKVVLTTTSSSYGYQASSNQTYYYGISELVYNGTCTGQTSGIQLGIKCVYGANEQNLNYSIVEARRGYTVNFTGVQFQPQINYTSLSYSWKIYDLSTSSAVNSSFYPSTLSLYSGFTLRSFSIKMYRVYIRTQATIYTPLTSFTANITSYIDLNIVSLGINISALASFSTQAWIGRYESFEVNPANYSYDTDYILPSSSLNFKFYCQVIPNSQGFYYYLNDSTSLTDLKTAKDQNLDLAGRSCFSSTDSYSFDSTGNILYITPDSLKYYSNGSNNVFIVTADNEGLVTHQIVYINIDIYNNQVPVGNFSCHTPIFCKEVTTSVFKISDSNNLFLDAYCESGCHYVDSYSFQFYFYIHNNSQYQLVDSTYQEFKYLYGADSDRFFILYNTFQTGLALWRVDLEITTVSYGVQTHSNLYSNSYALNLIPYNGTCSVSPLVGYALQTDFTIICKYWDDHDGYVVRYEYFSTYQGNTNPYGLSFDYEGNVTIKLPAGPASLNYSLTLFVCVFDNLDSPARFVISTPVNVFINNTLVSGMMSQITSNDQSSPIYSAINGGDQVLAANQIISLGSTLNILAESDPSFADDITKTKTAMVSLLTGMDVSDLSTTKVVATSLSTITQGYSTVDKDTANSAMEKSLALSQVMLDSINFFGFDFLMQAGNQIVYTMGNSLLGLNNYFNTTNSGGSLSSSDTQTLVDAFNSSQKILDSIVYSVNVYLFNGQTSTITTGSINMTNTKSYLSDVSSSVTLASSSGNGSFSLPDVCQVLDSYLSDGESCQRTFVVQQMYAMANTITGQNGQSFNISSSSTLSLSYFSETNEEMPVQNTLVHMWIPRSSGSSLPDFTEFNLSAVWLWNSSQLLNIGLNSSTTNKMIALDIMPENDSISYLVAMKYDAYPFADPTNQSYDSFTIFCPSDLINDGVNSYYSFTLAPNVSASLVGYGLRELDHEEIEYYCNSSSSTIDGLPILNVSNLTISQAFTSSFSYRLYYMSCLYLDKKSASWKEDGMQVQPDSNATHTHCTSTHLTDFAGSGIISAEPSSLGLPPAIDFSKINASFTDNLTIYLTVIITTCLYLLALVWCIWMDKRDEKKRKIYLLADNQSSDMYFYEMIVFTGNRRDAGTKSKVFFNLNGEKGDAINRCLLPGKDKDKILQRGSVDTFVFSTPCPLGSLTYVRIWHDNSGKGRQASWFLKLIIIHDLQTREQFYFICEKWIALDRGDGIADRLLLAAGEQEKNDVRFLIEKQTKEKLSDQHLWFSVLARPTLSSFTRADRLTCCFVLMYVSMLMNILYYGQSTSSGNALVFGPFQISQQQILTGVVTAFISVPPTLFLVYLFRYSSWRRTKTMELKSTMKESNSNAHDDPNSEVLVKKKKKFRLPWWFKIIAYILAFSYYAACATFVLIKAFTLGNDKVSQWLTSFIVSLFSDCFVSQPMQIAVTSFFLVMIFKKKSDKELEYDPKDTGRALNVFDKKKKRMNTEELNRNALIDRLTDLNRLSKVEGRDYKKRKLQERRHKENIREIIVYALFIWLILLIAFTKISSRAYWYQNSLQNLFYINDNTLDSFSEIKTTDQLWNWLTQKDTGFVYSMLSTTWYDNKTKDFSGFANDYVSFMIGNVLVRQLRVKNDSCSLANKVGIDIKNCYYDYSYWNEEDNDYGPRWSSYNTSYVPSSSIRNIYSSFQYSSGTELDSFPYVAQYSSYGAGGYAYTFNKSSGLDTVISDLTALRDNLWINQQTRALLLQFALYNPNVNLFSFCNIVFEILPSGSLVAWYQFTPFSLYDSPGLSALITACQIIYMLIIVLFLMKLIRAIIVKGIKICVTQFWFWVDISLIAFSWTAFTMFIYRIYATYELSNKLKNQKSERFFNLERLCYWESLLVTFISFCCFISIIKVFQLLRFNINFRLLVRTIRFSFKELVEFTLIFIFYWFAFANLFYFYFCSYSESFLSITQAMMSCGQILLGKYSLDTFDNPDFVIAPVILISYNIMMVFILMSLLIGVLTNSFSQLRNETLSERDPTELTMSGFLKEKFVMVVNAKKVLKKSRSDDYKVMSEAYNDNFDLFEKRSCSLINHVELKQRETKRLNSFKFNDN